MKFFYLKVNPYFLLFLFFGVSILGTGCNTNRRGKIVAEPNISNEKQLWCIEGITDLKPGDFLVKPNVSFMPGSSDIPNGWGFGHAAIVVKGYEHKNIDTLLANAIIVESMARDVPQEYQVREIAGYVDNGNFATSCTSFSSKYAGNRFRLRLKLPQPKIDSIVAFALDQKNDFSCWNAMKRFPENELTDGSEAKNWADNSHWYCSLLVWQSVLYVAGIDLDANGGYQVYPNDLISSKYFNIVDDQFPSRAKF